MQDICLSSPPIGLNNRGALANRPGQDRPGDRDFRCRMIRPKQAGQLYGKGLPARRSLINEGPYDGLGRRAAFIKELIGAPRSQHRPGLAGRRSSHPILPSAR